MARQIKCDGPRFLSVLLPVKLSHVRLDDLAVGLEPYYFGFGVSFCTLYPPVRLEPTPVPQPQALTRQRNYADAERGTDEVAHPLHVSPTPLRYTVVQ